MPDSNRNDHQPGWLATAGPGLLAALLIAASATFEVPGFYASGAAWAQTGGSATANAGAADETMFTVEDLNSLVAPIALFPDELLGLVLTAATEPLQIVQAQRFLDRRKKKPDLKANESWHTSVIGLLNYPELIDLMGDDLEWTEQLGLAYVYQPKDVMDAVQQFRAKVQVAGNLQSNDKTVIVQEKEVIMIVPAEPEVIYVPRYDPQVVVVPSPAPTTMVVYSNPYPPYYSPAATFYTGLFVGAAIAYGFNWHNNSAHYGGWHGNGWGGEANINIGGDVNIGNRSIDRDNVGVKREGRNAERDRRQAGALSDGRRRSEGRPTRSQEGLGRGQRSRGGSAGLAPAGRDRTSRARDANLSKQARSQPTVRRGSGSTDAFGGYKRGQDSINNGRRGSDSRQRRADASRSSRDFSGGQRSQRASRSSRDYGGRSRSAGSTSRRGGASNFSSYGSGSRAQRSGNRGGRSRGGGRRR
jgi:hypothetical protein